MAGTKNSRSEYFQLSSSDKQVIKKIEILTQSVERVYPSVKGLVARSFIQGVFFALGSTIGLSIIIALLTYIGSYFNLLPPLGDFFKSIQVRR